MYKQTHYKRKSIVIETPTRGRNTRLSKYCGVEINLGARKEYVKALIRSGDRRRKHFNRGDPKRFICTCISFFGRKKRLIAEQMKQNDHQ